MPTSPNLQESAVRDTEIALLAAATKKLIEQATGVEAELSVHVQQLWTFIDREELEK